MINATSRTIIFSTLYDDCHPSTQHPMRCFLLFFLSMARLTIIRCGFMNSVGSLTTQELTIRQLSPTLESCHVHNFDGSGHFMQLSEFLGKDRQAIPATKRNNHQKQLVMFNFYCPCHLADVAGHDCVILRPCLTSTRINLYQLVPGSKAPASMQ